MNEVENGYIRTICHRDGLIYTKDILGSLRSLGLGEEHIDAPLHSAGVIYMSGKHPYYAYIPNGNGHASIDVIIPDGPDSTVVKVDDFKRTVQKMFEGV
jgi:hypothetical protein